MTRDDVLRLAREAGDDVEHTLPSDLAFLERFAELAVAAAQAENKRLLSVLQGLVGEVFDLISESDGVAGLHLNGDLAPWGELVAGGRFERLAHLDIVEALIAEKNLQQGMTDAKLTV